MSKPQPYQRRMRDQENSMTVINVCPSGVDLDFRRADRYLPVRLSTTLFDGIGECMVIVANRADCRYTDLTENDKSEVFVTLKSMDLYDLIKRKVLNLDYWTPTNWYNTYNGLVDGKSRKVHLDGNVF